MKSTTANTANAKGLDADSVFLSKIEVAKRLGVSKTFINTLQKLDPSFPKPSRFSARVLRWKAADVDWWAESKQDESSMAC